MSESKQAILQALSNEIAQIYRTHYGRGPKKLTANFLGNAVVCLLEDLNAPAQTALLQRGKFDLAQQIHGGLQLGMADGMRDCVERVTGRTARAYVPGYNAEANAATDVFLLEPAPAA